MFDQNGFLKHIMQTMVQDYERNDKQTQNNVFKGDQTNDHFLSCGETLFWTFVLPFHFLYFSSTHLLFAGFLLAFFSISFVLHSYFQQGKLKLSSFCFWNLFHVYFLLSLGQHLIIYVLWSNPSIFALSVKGDIWLGF